jgi:chromosome segregation ATPase
MQLDNKKLNANSSDKEHLLLDEIEEYKRTIDKHNKSFKEEVSKYESTASVMAEELQQLQTILEQNNEEKVKKEKTLNEQVKQYKAKSEHAESLVAKLQSQLKQSEDNSSKIEKERASLASQCEVSQKKVAKLEQDLTSITAQLQQSNKGMYTFYYPII